MMRLVKHSGPQNNIRCQEGGVKNNFSQLIYSISVYSVQLLLFWKDLFDVDLAGVLGGP